MHICLVGRLPHLYTSSDSMAVTTATDYEVVIGLEVHAQLLTRSKMFCPCGSDYVSASPNDYVCPICLGMPGVLPSINRQAVEATIMTALALNCQISRTAKFDRKNYSYPDLMKGYQISQYDQPFSHDGWLEIQVENRTKRIGITRAHLEEDTAKLTHCNDGFSESYSLLDVNRAGVPLLEIVSEPDMRSAEEARCYLTKLQQILRYLDASKANMEEGNMRCEPNVSVRRRGVAELGTKVELKNINSFRSVYDAIEFEVSRQISLLESGQRIEQETRGWRQDSGQTVSQRSKELAHDYRYFPEPDLPVLEMDDDWVESIRSRMPELPDARLARLKQRYLLSDYDARLLVETRPRAEFFEAMMALAPEDRIHQRAKVAANWILSDFAGLLNAAGLDIDEARVTPEYLTGLIDLIESGAISGKIAKTVFQEMFDSGKSAKQIVEERGLIQITSPDKIAEVASDVLTANPKAAADYRNGKQDALNFLIAQAMRETKGRANPSLVKDHLLRILRENDES